MAKRYYLIHERRLLYGVFDDRYPGTPLPDEAYEWDGAKWCKVPPYEIADYLVGYEPDEEPGWRMWDKDIMEEIREISAEEAERFRNKG